jgi:hypothetical protein
VSFVSLVSFVSFVARRRTLESGFDVR